MKALNYCLVALIGLTIITSSCKKDDDKEETIILTDNDIKGNWSVSSVTGTSAYGISTATLIEFAPGGVLNLSGNMVGTGTWGIQNNNEIALNIFSTNIVMSVTSVANDRTTYTFTDPQGVIYVIVKNT
ncbi:MAG: hypothetical protein PHI28_02840 [Mangrovibacterium sp.]|nr:hypothetical protein [Mangrovibacterium sp.]